MLERSCSLHLLFLLVVAITMQVVVARSEERPDEPATLKAQVRALQDHEREQTAEIQLLRKQLASLEVSSGGQSKRRRALEEEKSEEEPAGGEMARGEEKTEGEGEGGEVEGGEGGFSVVEGGEGEGGEKEGGEGEGGEKEGGAEGEGEGEEALEEEEEEEELDPVDLTLSVSLLTYITMVMLMFAMVNYQDLDMRIYVWGVLSNTLSIFLAVLLFTTLNSACHHFIPKGSSHFVTIGVDFGELIFCFTMMQLAVAYISGSFAEQPFDLVYNEGDLSIEDQKAQKERRFKSVATLFAHMSGFSAISFGGDVQHLQVMLKSPALTFLVPPVLFLGQVLACRAVRKLRTHQIKQIKASPRWSNKAPSQGKGYNALTPEGGEDEAALIDWCVDKWDEETYESENEISSLAISFLFLQAIRYNLTGVMPDNMGIEEEHFRHNQDAISHLAGIGALFAVLCVVIVSIWYPAPEIQAGTLMSFVKRCVLVAQGTCAMGFAWALMYVSKWQLTLLLPTINPNCVRARVLLALTISAFAFIIILGLDAIADMKSTGEKADRAIIAIISSLGTLVGFTWEQSFDGAVETLAESCFKGNELLAEFALTISILVIVYPNWRRHILKTLLKLQKEREQLQAGE